MESSPSEDNISISSLSTLIWNDEIDTIENVQNVENTIANVENVNINCAISVIIREEDYTTEKDVEIVDINYIEGVKILSGSSFADIDRFQSKFDKIQHLGDCRNLIVKAQRKSCRVPNYPAVSYTHLTLPTIYSV